MVSGAESTEQNIVKMLEGVFSQWKDSTSKAKPGGDVNLADKMETLTQALRKMQMSEEKSREIRAVRSHIERRAELKQKTKMGMPNIASILTGGAESPMAGLGRIQGAVSEPFKASWEYKKAQDEQAGLAGKKDRSPEEEDRLKQLGEDMPGREKRAKSGFGKNLMGKKMQSLIGKTGKFMESSKGQGMMAGGMMGASILTMVIKKAMEASPMLQQMMKIMNVAMTLFLRPIGDFIGGMLKPIMLFFLREIAVPMLKKGKDFIKFGEAFGKNVLGFLLKPIETIQAAILGVFPFVSEDMKNLARNFDGIKEWMTEQKMNMIATDVLGEGATRQDLINMMNDSENLSASGRTTGVNKTAPGESGFDVGAWEELQAEFGTGWVPTLAESLKGIVSPLDTFKGLMTDASQNTYEYVTAQMKLNDAAGGVSKGMGAITGQFTLVSDATGKVVKAMTDLEKQIIAGQITEGAGPKTLEEMMEERGLETTNPDALDPEQTIVESQAEKVHWSKVTESLQAMFAAAGQQIREGLASASTISKETYTDDAGKERERTVVTTSDEYKTALAEYNELTKGGTQNVLAGIQEKFTLMKAQIDEMPITEIFEAELSERQKQVEILEAARIPTTHELALRDHLADITETTSDKVETQSEKTVNTYVLITKAVVSGYNKIKSMLASMSRAKALGNKKKKKFQFGGMINEPIWGIGESGTEYTLGEAGPEMVTPMGKGVGGIGPVTINVNVDSINSDVDLEKIKPIVERALLEVHSRRGII